jgi:uncharacterized membrane protein (UPF0127 family)
VVAATFNRICIAPQLETGVENGLRFTQLEPMLWTRFWTVLGLTAFLAAGCADSEQVPSTSETSQQPALPTTAQPRLVQRKLYVGPAEVTAEIAARANEIRTGMMFRTNVVEGDAMLFILGQPQQAGFWMMNCPTPLSCAYINPDGIIEEIHDMEPFNTNAIVADSSNILFVLETAQGWFGRNNVRTGMLVRAESGSLIETFFRPRTR